MSYLWLYPKSTGRVCARVHVCVRDRSVNTRGSLFSNMTYILCITEQWSLTTWIIASSVGRWMTCRRESVCCRPRRWQRGDGKRAGDSDVHEVWKSCESSSVDGSVPPLPLWVFWLHLESGTLLDFKTLRFRGHQLLLEFPPSILHHLEIPELLTDSNSAKMLQDSLSGCMCGFWI